jgi:hypothetical protein
VADIHNTMCCYQPDDSLDWVVHTSPYRGWKDFSSNDQKVLPGLWCQIEDAPQPFTALGNLLLCDNTSLIHFNDSNPSLTQLSTVKDLGIKPKTVSALFSILQQVCMLCGTQETFSTFVASQHLLPAKPREPKYLGSMISKLVAKLLQGDPDRKWVVLIHDADALDEEVAVEVGSLLTRLVQTRSPLHTPNLRIAALGTDPQKIPALSRHSAVVDKNTEWLGKMPQYKLPVECF